MIESQFWPSMSSNPQGFLKIDSSRIQWLSANVRRLVILLLSVGCAEDGPVVEHGPGLIYPANTLVSPLSDAIYQEMVKSKSSNSNMRQFAKVGDESSLSEYFLTCAPSILGFDSPWRETIAWFRVNDFDPFTEIGPAVQPGWSVAQHLEEQASWSGKWKSASPGLALVQLGAHDMPKRTLDEFVFQYRDLVSAMRSDDLLPVVTTMYPRSDEYGDKAARANTFLRAVAQEAKVPFLNLDVLITEDYMNGENQVNPMVARKSDGTPIACDFAPSSLAHGYNIRNLASVTALEAIRLLAKGQYEETQEVDFMFTTGIGTSIDPIVVPALPYVDMADTSLASDRRIDQYTGCGANQDESGPEVVYQLDVMNPGLLRAEIVDPAGVDVDVHILGEGLSGESCLARGHKVAEVDVEPGRYFIVVDSFVSEQGGVLDGEYALSVEVK